MTTDFTRKEFMTLLGLGLASSQLNTVSADDSIAAETDKQASWTDLRKQFLLPTKLSYLNNGSLGPCPRIVLAKTIAALRGLEQNPVHEFWGKQFKQTEIIRKKLANFVHCQSGEISITRNTTEGMNAIAQGIQFKPGDHILTTDQEHAGGFLCWQYYAKRENLKLEKIKISSTDSSAAIVNKFRSAITDRTRVISLSHITYTTGHRLPVKEIAELARKNKILSVVDGAQALGMIQVNLKGLGCDAYASSTHKWLLAPKGTGILYIRQSAAKEIAPLIRAAGPGTYSSSFGSGDLPGMIGLGAALNFQNALGPDKIEAHAMSLQKQLQQGLKKMKAVKMISPELVSQRSALTCFEIKGVAGSKVAAKLSSDFNTTVKTVYHGNDQYLRVSTHLYNTREEIEQFLKNLKKVTA
ncbi:MAG: aminotransferase class V-fold PLP-dependent enzyme [Lentisphaeria bacterium]|nr:aminotransferase class V-fold PLP-dependent enzyme [Lentisphaeria bacterium]NQZ66602.1 aminotransferase class V-fold PLP-dependent enzyme [Lentisphaeria bacterium]